MERIEILVKANELLDACGVSGTAGERVRAIDNITQIVEWNLGPKERTL